MRSCLVRGHAALNLAIVAATLCVAPTGALAARAKSPPKSPEKVEAQARFEKGQKAYNLGNFSDAIGEFSAAYELVPEPVFLFNIAQAHRQNGNPERALFFYRRYLGSNPDAPNGAEVERRIHDMEVALAAKKEPAPSPPTVAPPSPVQPEIVPAPSPDPTPAPSLTVVPIAASSPGRALRITGLSLGAVGIAGLVAGGYYATRVKSLRDQAFSGPYDDQKLSSAKTAQTVERVAFIAGGAALVTGGILYLLGYQSAAGPASVTIAPLPISHATGASLCTVF